jgi:metal-dependent hydrolase (beta-lactamase superfamily II)
VRADFIAIRDGSHLFAVISHRHGDHTGGMNYLLTVSPQVKIFAPKEGFGVFGASLPGAFYRRGRTMKPTSVDEETRQAVICA